MSISKTCRATSPQDPLKFLAQPEYLQVEIRAADPRSCSDAHLLKKKAEIKRQGFPKRIFEARKIA